jgi:hypothetical protein
MSQIYATRLATLLTLALLVAACLFAWVRSGP